VLPADAFTFPWSSSSASSSDASPFHVDGRLKSPSEHSNALLHRSDAAVQENRQHILFAHEGVGVVDTQVHPDLHGRVIHKTKSLTSMWNTVAGATKHVARKFFAASASSSSSSSNVKRASLRDLLKTEMRVQSKELDSATTGGIATDDAPPSTPTGDESDELLATWLVHFAPDVVLSDETTARFQSETGLTLGNYMPHHTYIVIATDSQIRRAREILADDFCDHISEYPVQAKVTTRSLAALMDRSEREISDANLPPFKDFRLNLQLQPLPSGEKRSLEQLEELAGLVQRFMQHHSLHAMEVRALPSFSNNLLMLLPLSTTTSSSTPSKDVPAVEVRRILQELSALVEVAFLELRLAHTLHNQYAQFLTQSGNPTPTGGPQNDGRPIWARGLRGEGQIVGCADSGCDWDHCYFNGPG
jgi:hypothetical protein